MSRIHLPKWGQFLWVKGHLGIPGNDGAHGADNYAKLGADLPLTLHPSEPGDVMDYGAPVTGGFLKRALRALLPGATKTYQLDGCHPGISTLKMLPHRFCTLLKWKRGILNMAGFTHWAVRAAELCTWCSMTVHPTSVQGTLARCTGTIPTAWRSRFFGLFPPEWDVPGWYATADRDAQRRFLRTLAPTSLIDHLQCKDIKVPSVRAAWQKMHKRWLGFWLTEKCLWSGGPRPGGSSQQTARLAAVQKSRIRQTAFRTQLTRMEDVAQPTAVRQTHLDQFLQPLSAAPMQPAHQYHQHPP